MKKKPAINGDPAPGGKRVIVIEASETAVTQKLRVAAYCRVSTDSSDQHNSFMAQTNYYAKLIASKENWTMADLYADEGVTGTSAEKRPDFQRLLADCRKGLVDKILVKSISRFARNTKDCLETIRELRGLGVSVCFEEQGIDTAHMSGELLTAVFAAIAQKESESISGNIRWSIQKRMQSGQFITCRPPFGYQLNNGKLEINEREADIVRMIFSLYLAGQSKDDIAAYVSTMGFPTRNGKRQWQHVTIASILQNERYIGDALLQKSYTTDTLPYRKKPNHGEREQYYLTGNHPPIIDRNTFQAVADLLARRAQKVTTERREESPFAKNIVCGSCGMVFKRIGKANNFHWICRNHYRNKNNCPVPQIPEKEIRTAFLRLYHKLKFHGPAILKQMLADFRKIRERQMLQNADVVELNREISDITDQNHMLTEMNKLGLVDPDLFISQSNELSQRLQTARRKKERLLNDREDDTVQKTQELLEMLDVMPDFLPTFDEEIFIDLVEKITVESGEQLRFCLRNGLILTEYIERTVR